MQTTEQVIAAHKANVETTLALATKAFDGVEKTIGLNLQAAKAMLGEAAAHARGVLSAKDAQELLALQTGVLQPAVQQTAAYSHHVADIAATTGTEVGKIVEAQWTALQKDF